MDLKVIPLIIGVQIHNEYEDLLFYMNIVFLKIGITFKKLLIIYIYLYWYLFQYYKHYAFISSFYL
jgi:hypothetical protein